MAGMGTGWYDQETGWSGVGVDQAGLGTCLKAQCQWFLHHWVGMVKQENPEGQKLQVAVQPRI